MRACAPLLAVLAAVAGGGCRRGARGNDGGTRTIEARLGGADRHRPFKPGRSALSLDEQAALERRGEFQALAGAELAAGRVDAADAALAKAPPSPSVDSDRAAIALQRGDVEGALDRLREVLRRAPGSPAALWNRALALRELGLVRGAIAAFDQVAALGEPGWAAEAKSRAATLRELVAARDRGWKQAQAAGRALVASGAPPPPSVLQAHPSYMRHFLYHALRAAPSLDRVRNLAPLASTLDARDGGDVLAALVARTAAHDLKARAPLAATYAKLSANPAALDAKAADAYLAALRHAHENDLLLGALILLNRTGEEMLTLARATNDPWYRAVAADYQAIDWSARNKLVEAESLAVDALADCRAHKLDFRCVYLASTLTDVYRLAHRTDDAQRIGRAAIAEAREQAPSREFELLMRVGEAARGRQGFALMEAFLDEGVRAQPDSCDGRRWAYELATFAHMMQLDFAGARAELDRAPRCDQPINLVRADTVADLARLGLGGPEAVTLRLDLDVARKRLGAGARAYADVVEARLVIPHDRAAGEKLLGRALAGAAAAAPDDVEAHKARAYAHLTRAVEAALAGDDATALAALAADVGAPPPTRCALGVAVDDERAIAVVRGSDGATFATVDRRRTSPLLDPQKLVPPPIRARLADCAEVSVFAPPPVHGLPGLLPPELAWSYRLRASPPPPARAARLRRVLITNPTPPSSLGLPRLADWRTLPDAASTTTLEGAAATPSRVLAEIGDATEIEVHAHGIVDFGLSDASVIALSPERDGRFALSARDVVKSTLRGRPMVILGACRAAQSAAYLHEPWGLPLAFLQAGAGAVFASPAPIGDADAGPFFAAVLAKVRDGASPARALRDERMRVLAKDAGNWVRQLLVFQ